MGPSFTEKLRTEVEEQNCFGKLAKSRDSEEPGGSHLDLPSPD